jgi:hypothetical protein
VTVSIALLDAYRSIIRKSNGHAKG